MLSLIATALRAASCMLADICWVTVLCSSIALAVLHYSFMAPVWGAVAGNIILTLLLIATTLEVSGDAVVRVAIYNHGGAIRIALFLAGAALLFGYGSFLNLAPLEFGRVVGIYIAVLFVVWQLINFVAFRTLPTMPILVGGGLVIAGGAIITFWRPA